MMKTLYFHVLVEGFESCIIIIIMIILITNFIIMIVIYLCIYFKQMSLTDTETPEDPHRINQMNIDLHPWRG